MIDFRLIGVESTAHSTTRTNASIALEKFNFGAASSCSKRPGSAGGV
jgi:hypothetical protein